MAANKIVTLGPVALTTTLTTNIWSPPTTTGGTGVPETSTNTYYIIRHIRIVNKTGSAATFSLWRGATAGNVAGTEVIGTATSVPANSAFDWYGMLRLAAGDTNLFLVGGAGTTTALTIQAEAEMGIVELMQRATLVGAGVATLAIVGLAVTAAVVLNDTGASTTCGTVSLKGTVASVTCGQTVASWVVGTSPPTTTTTVPTTTTTVATTTTMAVSTTTRATTTTLAGAPLTCTAFNAPTNVFTLNDVLGAANQINTATPLFTLQADGAVSSYTVKVDDRVLVGTYHNYTSATVCIRTPPLTDGTHTISAVELAPNAQQVAPYSFLVDTVGPAPPTITSASYVAPYVRMSGTCVPTFPVKVFEGFSLRGGTNCGATGLWSAAFSRPSGPHDLFAVQTDKAGNQSQPSAGVTVTVP